MLPTPLQCSTAPTRNVRSITQDISPFLQNLIFQNTNPLPFETEPHSIHTIRLLREHLDSYLYYIRSKTYLRDNLSTKYTVNNTRDLQKLNEQIN